MAHSKEEIVVRRIRIMNLILTPLLIVITGILINVISGSNIDWTQWIAGLLLIAVTVTAIVLGIIEYIFQNKAGQASSTVDQEDRQDFLEMVDATWIKEQLDRRFYGRKLIPLELLDESDVVDNPWREVTPLSRPLKFSPAPQKTSILQAYEASSGGGLLILGEPGSGKTIQLLELARDLLRQARENEQKRLPVVLILSSWTAKQSSFEDWLIKELQLRYKMPPPLAQKWVANDHRLLLLLLDGLDEVDIAFREICVEKLNDYSKNSGVPIVACCQSAAYEVLKKKKPLSLNKAVKLPPLTKEQIGSYISSAEIQLAPSGVPLSYISGEKRPLAPLRVALNKDSILQELAKTPLMLDVLTFIYQNAPEEDFSQPDTLEGKRKQVFKRFVEVTLEHRVSNKYFKGEQTLRWLTWLIGHDRGPFYLEQLQPSWLEREWKQLAYRWLGVRLPGIIIGGLIMIFVTCFTYENVGWQLVISVLSGALIGGLISGKQLPPKEKRQMWRFSVLRKAILLGLGIGLGTGLAAWWIEGFPPPIAWQDGIIFGLWGLLLMLLLSGSLPFPLVRQHTPSLFSRIGKWFRDPLLVEALKDGILIGILGMLSWGLSVGLNGRPEGGLGYGLLNAFVWLLDGGVGGALISFLVRRTSTTIEPAEKLVWWSRKRLYDGLINRRHFRNTLFIGFISILTISLVYGLSYWLNQSLSDGLNQGLSYELSQGLGWGIGLGGGLAGSYWLLIGLFQSVKSTRLKDKKVPNEGIRRSLKNGFLLGSLGGFISGIFVGFIAFIFSFGLKFGLSSGLLRIFSELGAGLNFALRLEPAYGLIFGLGGGLLIAMLYGCLAWWRHWLVRFLLWRSGVMPWQYVRVLDEATQRMLLHRVGGGYDFYHSELRDCLITSSTPPFP